MRRPLLLPALFIVSLFPLRAQTPPPTYSQWKGDWFTTGNLTTTRTGATATLLTSGPNVGQVLIVGGANSGGFLATAELYNPATGTYSATGSMAQARTEHTATLLHDGLVLIAGGVASNNIPVQTAELYDPNAGTFSSGGTMNSARYDHAAAQLANGLVLVTGGLGFTALNAAEYYIPPESAGNATGNWTSLPGMLSTRWGHTATTLADGVDVLIAGGNQLPFEASESQTTEIWSSVNVAWSAGPNMTTGRAFHTATLMQNGEIFLIGGSSSSAVCDQFVPFFSPPFVQPFGSLAHTRLGHTATLLPGGDLLIAGGTDAQGNFLTNAELIYQDLFGVPTSSVVSFPAGNLSTGRWRPAASLLTNGDVVVAGGSGPQAVLASSEVYDPLFNVPISTMSTGRQKHTATLLTDGNVLLAGGANFNQELTPTSVQGALSSSAYFAPKGGCIGLAPPAICFNPPPANTFEGGPPLNFARWGHTATLLPGPKVLIAGGRNGSSSVSQAELYLPAHTVCGGSPPRCFGVAAGFVTTGSMVMARFFHTATWIPTAGAVLLTGGIDVNGNSSSSAELYFPSSGTFSATGSMTIARFGHTATLITLADGSQKVLLTGGNSSSDITVSPTNSAELYDPVSGTFSAIANMSVARQWHAAQLLSNGKVLITGGLTGPANFRTTTESADIFDPATLTFTATGSMAVPRHHHTSTLTDLGNGKVLIAGGEDVSLVIVPDVTELYDPDAGKFSTIESEHSEHVSHTATLLDDGGVLIAGGFEIEGSNARAIGELLHSTLDGPPTIVISPQPDSGAAGTLVKIIGLNFGAQQLNSMVTFGGTAANISSWSTGEIDAYVPNVSGTSPMTVNVVVTVNGVASNAVSFTVTTATDVSISKSASTSQPTVGSNFSYALVVTNNGANTANNVTVFDEIPAGLSLVSAGSNQGTCSFSTGAVTCNIGQLVYSGTPTSATVTIVVTPTAAGSVTNTATVSELETDTNPANNTSSVTVTALVAGVDLIEQAVSNPPSGAEVTVTIRETDTVYNQGNTTAGPSVTRYYLSSTPTKSNGARLLTGSRSVPSLAPGAASTGAANLIVPGNTPSGVYYVLACANDTRTVVEANYTNNCTAAASTMTVVAPDLVETVVNNPPSTANLGSSFLVGDTTENIGTLNSGNSTLTRYYLSPTASKTSSSKLLIGSRSVPPLDPGVSSSSTATVAIPSMAAGTYFLLACANDTRTAIENNYANNCKAASATIVVTAPDLVETAVTNPPSTANPGAIFSVTDTTFNQGNGTAAASTTRYYLSPTPAKTGSSKLLTGSRAVPSLAPGASSTGSASVKLPTTIAAGNYFLLACTNDTRSVVESNFTNNCIASTTEVAVP